MLISETHFTLQSYFKLPFYSVYHTNHPAGTSAILIKSSIQHSLLHGFCSPSIQALTISVIDPSGPLTISAVYFPPNPTITLDHLESYYYSLDQRFLSGGDYNAKHPAWGSRLITPRGRVLFNTMERLHLRHLSTGEPTYWPSNLHKLPDLVDSCVTKGIPPSSTVAQSCFELSSDHSPVLISLAHYPLPTETPPYLSNYLTDWDLFRHHISDRLPLHIPLKTPANTEAAVSLFNDTVQWVGPPPPDLQPHPTFTTALPTSETSWKKSATFANSGNAIALPAPNEPSTELPGTSGNFSTSTTIIASKPSSRD
jgi:hypothetical protein